MEIIVEVSNLTVCYGQSEAVKDITFFMEKGDFIGVAGPNGAGKTTLIKVLLGLLPISKGQIFLFGKPQKSFSDWHKIGYLPQKISNINPVFPASVEEVVALGAKNNIKKADKILAELGLKSLKGKMLFELSGGQQQKVMLARALVSEPELLIFDEPSTALDPQSRKDFFRLIRKLNKEKSVSIMLVTHDTGYIGEYANKLLYVDQKMVHFGSISEFCTASKSGQFFEKSDQHIVWHQHA